jgi:GH25 family lysozyme M1 (1,4-beta-N-acetylmuramidase)
MRDAEQGARRRTAVRRAAGRQAAVWRAALGITAAVVALATAMAAPAGAAVDRPGPHGRLGLYGGPELRDGTGQHDRTGQPARTALVHPERDWMGSSVAAHEGRAAKAAVPAKATGVTQTPGFDVSNWQGTIDWPAQYAKGARFAYIKATEGTTYKDPKFDANYTNSYYAGFIRGAYHFARPDTSSGKAQADYFVSHGGGWSKDGKTLPPLLDIEYPAGDACYGLSKSAMVSWIRAFVNEVHAKTTRWATIYSTTDWWTRCTGDSPAFAADDPLFIARYASSAGKLPAGWPFYSFWQHADSGPFPGDQDYFNGPMSGLRNLANNT